MPRHAEYDPTTATLTYVRELQHDIARVWEALTDPEQLRHWFPSLVRGEFVTGSELRFEFEDFEIEMHGAVTAVEAPRLLEYYWGRDLLRFELKASTAGATTLTMIVKLEGSDKAARDAAGWHVCLDRLVQQLATDDAQAPTAELTGEWREHYAAYQARGLPALAELPE
jgi:uncharacterized protein YndB with AHSA1/START domain